MRFCSAVLGVFAATLCGCASAADAGAPGLEICDISGTGGLALAGSETCVTISGSTTYEFSWGNTLAALDVIGANGLAYSGDFVTVDNPGTTGPKSLDWDSEIEAYLEVVEQTVSDAGPASAHLRLYFDHEIEVEDEITVNTDDRELSLDRAFVAIGDQTILTAGVAGSIVNTGDDEPLDWLGTFNSEAVDAGVAFDNTDGGDYDTGDAAIQLVTALGSGVIAGIGLESLDGDGSAVGLLSYENETLTAHLSLIAGDILDATFADFALHAGATLDLDTLSLRAALAANDTGWWNGLVSLETIFDIVTLAATVDATSEREIGASASVEIAASSGVTFDAGLRWLDSDTAIADDDGLEAAAAISTALGETLILTGTVGHLATGRAAVNGTRSIWYVDLEASWAPTYDFSMTLGGRANTLGAYSTTFNAEKSFE
jgi:hypothetical protein